MLRGDSDRSVVRQVLRRETHMSHVFLAGDLVYKLKKPVHFPYLDFSTPTRREAACREELRLNRRLAPDIYREVVPLVKTPQGLAIGGNVLTWSLTRDLSCIMAPSKPCFSATPVPGSMLIPSTGSITLHGGPCQAYAGASIDVEQNRIARLRMDPGHLHIRGDLA